jgi:hypothetical protein
MTAEPSVPRLWLVRVVVPMALIVCAGLLVTRRPAAPPTNSELDSAQRLHRIGLAINDATARLGHPPADVGDLWPFLQENGDPDQLIVSPDDGQRYVILWGVDVRTVDPEAVLAYERLGSGGMRYVLTATTVKRLSGGELDRAEFPAGFGPPER